MKTRVEARELEQKAVSSGYVKRKNSKAIAKEVVDDMMEKYPNLIERLRLEEEKKLSDE